MTDAAPSPSTAFDEIAERAARAVLDRHGLEQEDGESAVSALGWTQGEGISHEAAFRAFAQALADELGVPGLVESRIELLGEYKLDYPQDYEPDDVDAMRDEIAGLQGLLEALG